MSTNYGRTSTASNSNLQVNQGTQNQEGNAVLSVPAGQVTALNVYMAGNGGTCRTRLCLWDSSGNLLAQSAQFTAASGSGGLNGQTWQRQVLSSPVNIPAGDYHVGFWRNPADGHEFSYDNSTGHIRPNVGAGVANVASPGSLNVSTATVGSMSAYLEWQPANVYDGPSGGGAPLSVQGIYQGPNGGGAPIAVLGVYQGPVGGGAPVRIF